VGEVGIVPVIQEEIGSLEDEPDKDGPGNHEQEFLDPAGDEGVSLYPIDYTVNGQDVRPPGKAVKPTKEGFNSPKEKEFAKDEENDP